MILKLILIIRINKLSAHLPNKWMGIRGSSRYRLSWNG